MSQRKPERVTKEFEDIVLFRANIAIKHGIGAAVVHERLMHWARLNAAEGHEFEVTVAVKTLLRLMPYLSERSIQRHLADLETAGFIEIEGHRYGPKRTFRFPFQRAELARMDRLEVDRMATSEKCPEDDEPKRGKSGDLSKTGRQNGNLGRQNGDLSHSLELESLIERSEERSPARETPARQSDAAAVLDAYLGAYRTAYRGQVPALTPRFKKVAKELADTLGRKRACEVVSFFLKCSKKRFPGHSLLQLRPILETFVAEVEAGEPLTTMDREVSDARESNAKSAKEAKAILERMKARAEGRSKP